LHLAFCILNYMPRVIGIDPGTVSLDLCGLDAARVFLDESIPTEDALADPSLVLGLLDRASPLDLVVGPSGYGLPLKNVRELSETDLRLACLAPRGESGGIGGLSSLMRALAKASVPVLVTPGVVHLTSVPAHRKINRVDMGTADKVCAVALAIYDHARRRGCDTREVSLILLELGGAFSAAIAVEHGRIVDGLGGSSGPLGATASGALDGEVAFLANQVTKQMIFSGGALSVAGAPGAPAEAVAEVTTPVRQTALEAYLESIVKAVASLTVSAPSARTVVLSGRLGRVAAIRGGLVTRLSRVVQGGSVEVLSGFAAVAKHAAQGAALLADGLAGGSAAGLVETLGIRDATGTVLDHLYVISPEAARRRLGIE
jgi:predicted butyrate kinase (DUF1464 family)